MTVANGILCPACGAAATIVLETRRKPKSLRRVRVCYRCDRKFSTIECIEQPALRPRGGRR